MLYFRVVASEWPLPVDHQCGIGVFVYVFVDHCTYVCMYVCMAACMHACMYYTIFANTSRRLVLDNGIYIVGTLASGEATMGWCLSLSQVPKRLQVAPQSIPGPGR